MVTAIGEQTSARQRRRIAWAQKLHQQLDWVKWSPKRFVYELNEAGCKVSRQAVDQWLTGKSSPSPENQVYIAKVLHTAPHILFPVDAA